MTPMLGVVIYLVVAVIVGVVYHKICEIEYKYRFEDAFSEDAYASLLIGIFWPIFIFPMLWRTPKIFELHAHVKRIKAIELERKNRQLQIEKRKRIIEEINADTDRFEQTRREDIMSGREIVDIREGEARKLCYICNQTRSPYVRRRAYDELHSAYNGTLINTISKVPAHEECIMGELNLRE